MKTIQIIAVSALFAQGTICWASEGILTYTPSDTVTLNGTAGWSFEPTTAISVTALGVFDDVITHQSPLTVGLWSQSGSLLASATVTSSDPLVDQTVYQSIAPVALTAGDTYYLGAYSLTTSVIVPSENPPDGGSATMSPQIQLGSSVWSTNGVSPFPDTIAGPSGSAILAPNFEFSVPEPSVDAFLVLGGAILAWRQVRKVPK